MIISVTQMKPFITKSGNYSTPAPQVSYTTFPRLDSCTHSDWAFDFAEEKKNGAISYFSKGKRVTEESFLGLTLPEEELTI